MISSKHLLRLFNFSATILFQKIKRTVSLELAFHRGPAAPSPDSGQGAREVGCSLLDEKGM